MSQKQERQSASKKQALQQERRKKEQQKRLRLMAIIAGIAILIVVSIVLIRNFTSSSMSEVVQATLKARPQAVANNTGDPNAPVKIVEFSDFQCPYCKQFADQTEQALIDTYVTPGKVYFTYRSMGNFVSRNIGKGGTESRDSAEAAYCAGDQGKFWEYKDTLFANWQGEDVGSFSGKRLNAMAEQLGLDLNKFSDCMSSNKFLDQVNQDFSDGSAAGVTGTPSFLINGKLITGAQPLSVFQKEIEAALQASGN
jgi:protein-disulfide isomerase